MFAHKMKKMSFLVGIQTTFMLMLLALFCSTAAAQTTGTIYGQVSDPSGAAVPEANITAQNTATGLERKAVTNPVGSYLVPSLPPGPYKLTVERTGFKTYAQSGITVIVGENARVDAALVIGAVTQTVEVSASAVRVDTQSTTVGTTVDNRRVESMPLNGRNLLALTQLLPGVGTADFPTQNMYGRLGPQVSISGARPSQNNMMLDGTNMVHHITNVMQNLPSPDALQEFRILTNTYSAEYGRASGGVLLSVTKSGTNEFHGSLYEYLRNDALNARNFFAPGTPMLRQNQFGGSIGGPVILPRYNGRDRTFFFFNYQGLRIRQQNLLTSFPPTAQERQGIFATPITDPTTGQPFANNTIPPDRFDPLAKGFLEEYLPLPNMPDGRYLDLAAQPISGNSYIAKVDHQISDSDRLSGRFYRDFGVASNKTWGDIIARGLEGIQSNLTQTENLTYTKILSPRLLNEVTFSHLRANTQLAAGPNSKSPKDLGGNFNYEGPVPGPPWVLAIGRFISIPWFYVSEIEDTYSLYDKLTWTHGRHSVKAGTQLQLRGENHSKAVWLGSAGMMVFVNAFTGNTMADYLIGSPVSYNMLSMVDDFARSSNYHAFVQDDFKVNSRLTLNLGLRYELNTPWTQVQGWAATFHPGEQSQKFPNAPPGLVYPGDPGVPPGLVPPDKNNWQPRIGLAWDPTGRGRTAIRGAFAVFTNTALAIYTSGYNLNAPYSKSLSFFPHSFSDPYDVAHGGVDPFPYVVTPATATFSYPLNAYMIDPDFRDGYVEQWNFNIQHEFGPSVLVKAGYYGLVGHKLPVTTREKNQPVYGPGATEANAQSRRPILPQYYASIQSVMSVDNSAYHSLQVSVDKKFSRSYTLQLAYTFSKSIDTNPSAAVQDANNPRKGERGLSDFSQGHMLAVNGIWELPFMKQNRFLGGWQVAALTRITSGFPFSINSGCDCALIGLGFSAYQRADLVGNWRLDPNRPHGELVAAYFDKSAFAQPEIGKFGNSGRNIVIGPGYSHTDLSLQKKFKLPGERGAIEFRADFFNLFNEVNFGNPDSTLTSPAFGRILSARDARIVQLALRYDF